MKKFQCDCCGLCCKHINTDILKNFDRGDGVCKFLDENNFCKIYDNRPDFCNVEVGYKKFFSNLYTKEEFFEMNYKICAALKKENFND